MDSCIRRLRSSRSSFVNVSRKNLKPIVLWLQRAVIDESQVAEEIARSFSAARWSLPR